MLDKKVCSDYIKNYKILLGKKLFSIVIKILFVFLINSNIQELINKFLNVFNKHFIIKATQRNLIDFISFFLLIFTLNPIHQMSQTFLIQQNIFIFIMTHNILFMLFAFLCSLLSCTKYEYIFGFNPRNSSIATTAVSSFILPTTNLFELS